MISTNAKKISFSDKYWHNQLKLYNNIEFKNKRLLYPSKLEFNLIDKSDLKEMPYIIAIDTETFSKNGNLICLCNSENNNILYGTVDHHPSIDEYFEYFKSLVSHKRNVCFFAYNLKFDASIILKTLNIDIEKFYEEEFKLKTLSNIEIIYLNKKCLSLSKNGVTINIFDALQYFLGAGKDEKGNSSSSLDSVARTYLGEQKQYKGKYQDKQFPDNIEPSELYEIVQYCILDCKLTSNLMKIWLESFKNNFGFYPNKFYSAGFLSLQVLKTSLNEFFIFKNAPFIVQDLAYRSYYGGRFEITRKGYMENIYHYDIRSAYPYAMSILPDFKKGRWIRIKSKEEFFKYRKMVGFYQIIVNVKELNLSPFLFRTDSGEVLTPRGKFVTTVTGYELDQAFEFYDFDLIKIEGFAFIPVINYETEFNRLIKSMYNTRMKQTNEGQKYVYKVIINSIYGKTAQSKPEPKGIFNPVLCASITGHTRSLLLNACKDNKKDIVMLATDGIFSNKKLDLPIGNKLGNYDFEFHPKFILLMAGIYSYNTEKNPELKPKSRGFSLVTYEEGKKKMFDFDEYGIIQEEGNYFYQIENKRPLSIAKSVIENQYSPSDIGKFISVKKKIDLNGDHKRLWHNNLKSLNDYSDSNTFII